MVLINKISQFRKSLLIVMGLLVAAYVLTEQACDDQSGLINEETTELSKDSSNEEEKPLEVLQVLTQQMLPAVSVEIEPFEAFFIRELFVESEEQLPYIASVPLEDTHYFRTLFRQIQSPNAP